jgi:hypothetical protein
MEKLSEDRTTGKNIGTGKPAKRMGLKVHKREIFSNSDFECFTISGFVTNIFWLGHYWGRQDYSA